MIQYWATNGARALDGGCLVSRKFLAAALGWRIPLVRSSQLFFTGAKRAAYVAFLQSFDAAPWYTRCMTPPILNIDALDFQPWGRRVHPGAAKRATATKHASDSPAYSWVRRSSGTT
jgi:hypothetical protein